MATSERTPVQRVARIGRLLVGIGCGVLLLASLLGLGASRSAALDAPPPFSATASADGVRQVVTIPGAPVTSTPIDAGGPTAQAAFSTFGSSQGYAALPDPGDLVVTAPGLVTGLLSSGAAGLPPLNLPTLPKYPLFVESSMPLTPTASSGAGPYMLRATSSDAGTDAQATGGFQVPPAGNAALTTSNASISQSGPTARATATSDTQGVTVGPLTIGEITATATMELASDGTVNPSESLEVAGMKIGGVAIDLTPSGLNLGGPVIPVALQAFVDPLLKAAGVTLRIQPAQTTTDGVIAPALVITTPVQVPGVGAAAGTMTLTIGAASASLQTGSGSGSAASTSLPAAITGPTPQGISGTNDGSVGTGVSSPVVGGGAQDFAGSSPSAQAPSLSLGAQRTVGNSTGQTEPSSRGVAVGTPINFTINSLYVLVALLGLVALFGSNLVRLFGVRIPWKSNAG